MAFAEGGKGTEYVSTCHSCGNKCKGGWRKCKNITQEHRSKVAALEAQGHFRHDNNNIIQNWGTFTVDSRMWGNLRADRGGTAYPLYSKNVNILLGVPSSFH